MRNWSNPRSPSNFIRSSYGLDSHHFFHLGFLSQNLSIYRTAGEGGDYLCKTSLPFPPASQILRHQPGGYCRELTSAHSQQPDSNREPLVSEHKLLKVLSPYAQKHLNFLKSMISIWNNTTPSQNSVKKFCIIYLGCLWTFI